MHSIATVNCMMNKSLLINHDTVLIFITKWILKEVCKVKNNSGVLYIQKIQHNEAYLRS